MLFVTDPQGRKKDYIVVPAEWDSTDLGPNLGVSQRVRLIGR